MNIYLTSKVNLDEDSSVVLETYRIGNFLGGRELLSKHPRHQNNLI